MILIFGGAYQGKREFTKQTFSLKDSDIYELDTNKLLSFDFPAIDCLEKFIEGCIDRNENPIKVIEASLNALKDKIIICNDISCGIVPMLPRDRLLRDNTGKVMQIISRNADEVYRVFCGLGERIK